MYYRRSETIFFDFKEAEAPNNNELLDWILSLGIQLQLLASLDYNHFIKCVTMKFHRKEDQVNFLGQYKQGIAPFKKNNKEYNIPINLNNARTRQVRARYIGLEADIGILVKELSTYGTIYNAVRDTWKLGEGISIGKETILVYMDIVKNIPSWLLVEGTKINITYMGQPPTCSECNSPDHKYFECPSKRKRRWEDPTIRPTNALVLDLTSPKDLTTKKPVNILSTTEFPNLLQTTSSPTTPNLDIPQVEVIDLSSRHTPETEEQLQINIEETYTNENIPITDSQPEPKRPRANSLNSTNNPFDVLPDESDDMEADSEEDEEGPSKQGPKNLTVKKGHAERIRENPKSFVMNPKENPKKVTRVKYDRLRIQDPKFKSLIEIPKHLLGESVDILNDIAKHAISQLNISPDKFQTYLNKYKIPLKQRQKFTSKVQSSQDLFISQVETPHNQSIQDPPHPPDPNPEENTTSPFNPS